MKFACDFGLVSDAASLGSVTLVRCLTLKKLVFQQLLPSGPSVNLWDYLACTPACKESAQSCEGALDTLNTRSYVAFEMADSGCELSDRRRDSWNC